jgi:hypothetical protein
MSEIENVKKVLRSFELLILSTQDIMTTYKEDTGQSINESRLKAMLSALVAENLVESKIHKIHKYWRIKTKEELLQEILIKLKEENDTTIENLWRNVVKNRELKF